MQITPKAMAKLSTKTLRLMLTTCLSHTQEAHARYRLLEATLGAECPLLRLAADHIREWEQAAAVISEELDKRG